MSANVDEIITRISACEIDSVRYANSWKLSEKGDNDSPDTLDEEGYKCKKR